MRTIALAFPLCFAAAPAWALEAVYGVTCGPTDGMMERAQTLFGERPAFQAQSAGTSSIIVVVNDTTGTFTILLEMPKAGMACMISAGRGWRAVGRPS